MENDSEFEIKNFVIDENDKRPYFQSGDNKNTGSRNIREKNINDKVKIEIDEGYERREEERKFVQTSLIMRKRLKRIIIVVTILATLSAAAIFIFNILKEQRENSGQNEEITQRRNVILTVDDNTLLIRSGWSEDKDIAYRAYFGEKSYYGFDVRDIIIIDRNTQRTQMPKKGEKFVDLNGSISPLTFKTPQDQTVGLKSGWQYGVKINCQSHSLTQNNIGCVYSDAASREYTVVKIVDENSFIVYPSSDSLSSNSYDFELPSSYLYLVSGNGVRNLKIESEKEMTLAPAFSNVSCVFSANEEQIDPNNFEYMLCDKFQVNINFDVPNIISKLKVLEKNVGDNTNDTIIEKNTEDLYMNVSYVFTFTENGACTLNQSITSKSNLSIHSLSALKLPVFKVEDSNRLYVPNSNTFNFVKAANEDGTSFYRSSWSDAANPPHRFYSFKDDELTRGLCVGYCNDKSDTKTASRSALINNAAYFDMKKGYITPFLISQDKSFANDSKFEFISYIIPFEKNTNGFKDEELTAICWYFVGDDIYLMIDAHKAIDKDISLPEYMDLMKIQKIDVSDNITIEQTTVNDGKIHVKTSGNYSYAVMKLTK